MAITAGQVTTTSTLEQFRVEFNKLQTDVSGIEAGSLSFTNISATQISVAELTVTSTLAAASFIFEGTTDDDNETTLSVVDPTADRTLNLPNESGTILSTGTTANTFITGQTSIASAGIDSGNDELLVSDADASTFKRITVDNLISSAGGLTSVAADSTPQLGGDLDVVTHSIVSTSNRDITLTPNGTGDVNLQADTVVVGDSNAAATITSNGTGDLTLNTNSGTDSSAITITDAANGNISATLNGTAVFQIDGTDGVEIQQGAISIKNGGTELYVRFYCESSNAHYAQLQAPAHADLVVTSQ